MWLTRPGPVLLKRHVRNSKYEPLVEEVQLVEANPNYAYIQMPSGVEKTVSLRDLAPAGDCDPRPGSPIVLNHDDTIVDTPESEPEPEGDASPGVGRLPDVGNQCPSVREDPNEQPIYFTQSGRESRRVERLGFN